jgi:uncharacterized protein (UPF0335 family)
MKSSPAIDFYLFNVIVKQQLKEIINVIDRLNDHMQFKKK